MGGLFKLAEAFLALKRITSGLGAAARRGGIERGVAVPVLQLGQTKPLGLHLVVAMRQAGIRVAHGGRQRIDDLILHHVGTVAETGGTSVVAPRILDLLILGQGVGN